jgi:hypothetical protein
MRCFLPLLACALVVTGSSGCTDAKADAERKVAEVGVAQLRKDAARIYKDVFARPAPPFEEVHASMWPASFRAFHPHHVGVASDGISLSLVHSRDAESGLYIVPWQMERTPSATPNASFQPIADGIYWYSFRE